MEERTYIGTWEEIARLGAELAGCKVRLTILDESPSAEMLDRALAQLITDAERLAGSLPPVSQSPVFDAWRESVVQKYGREGFTL